MKPKTMKQNLKLLKPYKPLGRKNKRYFFVTGGRGSAKSFHVALFLLNLTYQKNEVILFTRYTMKSAHISIIPEFLAKIELLDVAKDFHITKTEIINLQTNSRIIFAGIKTSSGNQTANLKSIEGLTCWVLDEGEELNDEEIFNTIDFSIRVQDKHNRVIVIMNPSHTKHMLYQKFMHEKRNDTVYIHTTYLDNIKNLSQSSIEQAERLKELNYKKYAHIFLGEWIDEVEGALWSDELIQSNRVSTYSVLKKIVVSIDPAITAHANSDETGIVVVGIDARNIGYVLEDISGKYLPMQWAKIAINAYDKWKANEIIAEGNQGGDMVKSTIEQIKKVPIRIIWASRGKIARAEPISVLYEEGKIKHVGTFLNLENEMTTYTAMSKQSPNRLDALVHGLSHLMLKQMGNISTFTALNKSNLHTNKLI
jgi:phage terminase large subunit-like protein